MACHSSEGLLVVPKQTSSCCPAVSCCSMDWWNGLADPYVVVRTVTPAGIEIEYRCARIKTASCRITSANFPQGSPPPHHGHAALVANCQRTSSCFWLCWCSCRTAAHPASTSPCQQRQRHHSDNAHVMPPRQMIDIQPGVTMGLLLAGHIPSGRPVPQFLITNFLRSATFLQVLCHAVQL
jgi:hypothetical protein